MDVFISIINSVKYIKVNQIKNTIMHIKVLLRFFNSSSFTKKKSFLNNSVYTRRSSALSKKNVGHLYMSSSSAGSTTSLKRNGCIRLFSTGTMSSRNFIQNISTTSNLPLQHEWYPTGTCFGCGPSNVNGLQLKCFALDLEGTSGWSSNKDCSELNKKGTTTKAEEEEGGRNKKQDSPPKKDDKVVVASKKDVIYADWRPPVATSAHDEINFDGFPGTYVLYISYLHRVINFSTVVVYLHVVFASGPL